MMYWISQLILFQRLTTVFRQLRYVAYLDADLSEVKNQANSFIDNGVNNGNCSSELLTYGSVCIPTSQDTYSKPSLWQS